MKCLWVRNFVIRVEWLCLWPGLFLLYACTGLAADVNVSWAVDRHAEYETPASVITWQKAAFPLWLDQDAARYWLKCEFDAEEPIGYLDFGWPNIWQWQMVTQTVCYLENAVPGNEMPDVPSIMRDWTVRTVGQAGAGTVTYLRLDCLPYHVCIPGCQYASVESILTGRGHYAVYFSIYLGMAVVLVLAAASLWILVRDRIFLFYILMVLGGVVATYAQMPVFTVLTGSFPALWFRNLFNISIVVFYIGTFLFALSFLDAERHYRWFHGLLNGFVSVGILYLIFYRILPFRLQETIMYGLDICALIPVFIAMFFWRKGSYAARYYVCVNLVYMPIYIYFCAVSNASMTPFIPLHAVLILGAVTECIGYSVALAYRLNCILKHKQTIEEQNRILQRKQMETALLARDAELRMLRFQMNPHFLFNALNSLIAEIGECPKHAVQMARKLSEYLRYTLTSRNWISVDDELEAIQRYLDLENFRYEDKLVTEIHVDEKALPIRIPMFSLQPLVENALKYGMQTSAMPLRVEINVCCDEQNLIITVKNSGRWIESAGQSTSIGLANIRERIDRFYEGAASLGTKEEQGAVTVTLLLPLS